MLEQNNHQRNFEMALNMGQAAAQPTTVPAEAEQLPASEEVVTEAVKAESPVQEEQAASDPLKVATFTVSRQYLSDENTGFDPEDEETISLPAGTMEETRDALRDTSNIDPKKFDKTLQSYMQTVSDGLSVLPFAVNYKGLFTRYGSDYDQVINAKGGIIGPFAPKLKLKEGVKPVGEAARELVRRKLKIGNRWTVPLYHSGFHVTLFAPSDSELIDLFEEIDREKMLIGRHTYGNALSNNASYSSKIIMDFIDAHLLETSLTIPEDKSLRDYALHSDLQALLWGLACLVWPNGFQQQRPCITNVEKCKHVFESRIAIQRLSWCDKSRLTDRQKNLLLKRERNSVSLEEIKIYQADFVHAQPTMVELPGDIKVVFKMPTIAEHIDYGYRWVSELEERFTNVLTKEPKDRENYLMEHAQASVMRQYAHMVKAIVVDDVEIDDVKDIEDSLNDITSIDEPRDAFIKEALNYIENSTISGVGVPTHHCPNCGGNQRPHNHVDVDNKYPEIIPLDISQLFFQMLFRRITKIRRR